MNKKQSLGLICIILLLFLSVCAGCSNKYYGENDVIFTGGSPRLVGEQIVADVTIEEAYTIAKEYIDLHAMPETITVDHGRISFSYDSKHYKKNSKFRKVNSAEIDEDDVVSGWIQPVYLEDGGKGGVTYLYSFTSVEPQYYERLFIFRDKITDTLREYAKNNGRPLLRLATYTVHENMPRKAPVQAAPLDVRGFAYHLSKLKNKTPFEGVYETSDGLLTVGILRAPEDRRNDYHATILESRVRGWSRGDVIIKFRRLEYGVPCLSRYYGMDHKELGLAWKVGKHGIESVGRPGGDILLIRDDVTDILDLPDTNRTRTASVPVIKEGDQSFQLYTQGTAWLISKSYLVTCEHVVNSSEYFFIRIGDEYRKVRVVAVDAELDLALLKVVKGGIDRPLLSLRKNPRLPNGTRVYPVGHPKGDMLGTGLKITEGIVSGQSGLGGKSSRYQITAEMHGGVSGGPVVDEFGSVAGVAVSGLRHDVATNINFMVKYQAVKMFLSTNGAEFVEEDKRVALRPSEIFERYEKSVFLIWGTFKLDKPS